MHADGPRKVDVQVVRHAYRREGSPTPADGPLRKARSYIQHHLRHPSEGTPKSVEQERTGDSIEAHVAPAGAEPQKEPVATGLPKEEAATVTHIETDQNDEEDWASEDSGEGTIASSSAARVKPGERRRRVRSSKGKAVVKAAGTGLNKRGRRGSSMSEQSRSSPQVRSPSADTTPTPPPLTNEPEQIADVPEDADRRGRSTHHERKSSGLSLQSSIQHRRLESLRLAQHSRDASPSRSIRFADEQRSGTSTPRNGVSQNESWLLSNQIDDRLLDEDAESARGRVTFELPAKH